MKHVRQTRCAEHRGVVQWGTEAYGMGAYFHRLRNVLVVLIAVGLGIIYPSGAVFVQPLTGVIVTLLVFSSLRGISLASGRLRESVVLIGTVLLISYVAIPILGIRWAGAFLKEGALLGAAAMLAAPATAGSAIVWTRVAGGNDELSGIASLVSIGLAPIMTPLLLVWIVGGVHALPIAPLASQLLFISAGAVALLLIVPADAVADTTLEWGSVVAILLLIYAGVGTAGIGNASVALLAHVGGLVVVVFVIGIAAAVGLCVATGWDRLDIMSVFYTGTLKNLGISLVVVLPLGSTAAIHAVIVYYVSQQFLSAVLLDGLAVGGSPRAVRDDRSDS